MRARVAAMKTSAARGRSSGSRPSSQGAGGFAWRVAARPVSKTVVVSDDGRKTYASVAADARSAGVSGDGFPWELRYAWDSIIPHIIICPLGTTTTRGECRMRVHGGPSERFTVSSARNPCISHTCWATASNNPSIARYAVGPTQLSHTLTHNIHQNTSLRSGGRRARAQKRTCRVAHKAERPSIEAEANEDSLESQPM